MTLSAAQMRSLPEFFQHIDDPRRRQGRRHALPTVLLAAAATLCGMRGYKATSANGSTTSAPGCCSASACARRDGQYRAPSLSAMRSLLIRLVDPVQLDAALRAWHEAHGSADSALAIDGKTIRGAIDDDGQTGSCARHHRPRHQGSLGSKKVGMRPDADERGEAHQRDRHRHPPARYGASTSRASTVTGIALLKAGAGLLSARSRRGLARSPSRATSRPCLSDIRAPLNDGVPVAHGLSRTCASSCEHGRCERALHPVTSLNDWVSPRARSIESGLEVAATPSRSSRAQAPVAA